MCFYLSGTGNMLSAFSAHPASRHSHMSVVTEYLHPKKHQRETECMILMHFVFSSGNEQMGNSHTLVSYINTIKC